MARINTSGYIERRINGVWREWWILPRYETNVRISFSYVDFPLEWSGKKIKLKVEVMEE